MRAFGDDDVLAVEDLEGQLVDVHRVSVSGGVVELPHFGRADRWVLGDRVRPRSLCPHSRRDVGIACHGAEQGLGRGVVEERRRLLEQGQPAGHRRGRQRGDGRQLEEPGRSGDVDGQGGHDTELHDLAGRVRVGDIEVVGWLAASERFVGS